MGIKNKTGFTLLEIAVTVAILAVAAGLMYGTYYSGVDIFDAEWFKADLQARTRIALSSMISELRHATRTSTQNPSPNLSIPSPPGNKTIHFYLPHDMDGNGLPTDANGDIEWDTNKPIDYQYISEQKQLKRLENGEYRFLAHSVSDVQFIDHDIDPALSSNELKIILTLTKKTPKQKDVSITLSGIVKLRN